MANGMKSLIAPEVQDINGSSYQEKRILQNVTSERPRTVFTVTPLALRGSILCGNMPCPATCRTHYAVRM